MGYWLMQVTIETVGMARRIVPITLIADYSEPDFEGW